MSDPKVHKQPTKVKLTSAQLLVETALFLVMIMCAYLMLSLISFDPADPSWSQTAWHDPIHNWGGAVGAYLSDIFLQFFGFVSYFLPILIIIFCAQAMVYLYRHRDKPINYFSLSLRVIGFLAFTFSATGFFALNIQDLEQFQAGGILGAIVVGETLPFLGHIGTSVVTFLIAIASVTLLTGLSWFFIAELVGLCVVSVATPILAFIASRLKRTEQSEIELEHDEPQLNIELSNTDTNQLAPVLVADSHPSLDVEPSSHFTSAQTEQIDIDNAIAVAQHDELAQDEPCQLAPQTYQETYLEPESIPEIMIDENSLPPKIIHQQEDDVSREFTINADYYSPIAQQTVPQAEPVHITDTPNEQDEPIALVEIDEDDLIAPIGSYAIPAVEPEVVVEPAIFTPPPHFEIEPVSVPESIATLDDELAPQITMDAEAQQPEQVQQFAAQSEQELEPVARLTKDNVHDSLIHPLLQKESFPLKKPTTPLPSLDLLTAPPVKQVEIDHNALKATAALIEKSLSDFRVKARVVDYLPGPVITRFEIELAPGVKASRISTLDRDLARSLSMPSVRVVEVIPGKPYVGIELPNKHRQTVYFREVLDSPQFTAAMSPLTIVLGKDIAGQSVVADLAKMPHLLVAGTTGSGKSVGVNAMILSILYKSQPEDVRFIMIDPKMLELSVYEGIPHLLTDVVTDMKDACNALNWCVNEMEKRYRLMSSLGVRNLAGYNDKIKLAQEMGRPIPDPLWRPGDSMDIDIPMLEKLPYIVVLVDEFADLIMAVGKKVEELIARLAQKARAAGIHLVLATQRPSVDVITGLIKANIPTRIAFTVSSKIDSRTILDQMGAESLLGMGDMLYLAPNSSIPIRVHGAFVRDEEVHAVVQDWKARGIPTQYIENITVSGDDADADGFDNREEDLDPLFDQVVAFVVDKRRASISSVQRQFRIGYNRAARIVEQMEMQGIVSAPSHNGNREVLAPPSGQDY